MRLWDNPPPLTTKGLGPEGGEDVIPPPAEPVGPRACSDQRWVSPDSLEPLSPRERVCGEGTGVHAHVCLWVYRHGHTGLILQVQLELQGMGIGSGYTCQASAAPSSPSSWLLRRPRKQFSLPWGLQGLLKAGLRGHPPHPLGPPRAPTHSSQPCITLPPLLSPNTSIEQLHVPTPSLASGKTWTMNNETYQNQIKERNYLNGCGKNRGELVVEGESGATSSQR